MILQSNIQRLNSRRHGQTRRPANQPYGTSHRHLRLWIRVGMQRPQHLAHQRRSRRASIRPSLVHPQLLHHPMTNPTTSLAHPALSNLPVHFLRSSNIRHQSHQLAPPPRKEEIFIGSRLKIAPRTSASQQPTSSQRCSQIESTRCPRTVWRTNSTWRPSSWSTSRSFTPRIYAHERFTEPTANALCSWRMTSASSNGSTIP
jgi:hypothetical protein